VYQGRPVTRSHTCTVNSGTRHSSGTAGAAAGERTYSICILQVRRGNAKGSTSTYIPLLVRDESEVTARFLMACLGHRLSTVWIRSPLKILLMELP
jgi:hypothetical protein